MPRPGFVVVEAEFVLGGLEAVFDRPAMAFDGNEGLNGRAGWAPCREESEIIVADSAADQKVAGPKPGLGFIIFVSVEIGEFAVGPVMEPGTFGALTSGKSLPCAGFKVLCNLCSGACDWRLVAPRAEVVIRSDPQNIAFTGAA